MKKRPPSTISESGSYSDPYLDPDTEPDIGQDSDSESEFLQQRINYHETKGRAKPRRSNWTNSLVKREVEHWQKQAPPLATCAKFISIANSCCLRFCQKVKADPDEILLKCEAKMFKTYLEWHVKTSRIKKESAIRSYWKRISLAYIDLAGSRMDNGAELDIRDVCV
jgi:hypothetical protein